MTNPISDLEEAGCLFVVGSNTTEAHPVAAIKIKRAVKQRGAKLIVANPKRINLAKLADVWLRHRPGTDVALLNGIARIILDEGLADLQFIEDRTENFNDWKASLQEFTPEYVSRITGVPVADLYRAARLYAKPGHNGSSIVYAMGITQHRTGTDNVFAVANLAMVTGNLGKAGAGVNPLRGQNNVQGACDMGCLPDVYTGYQKVASEEARAKFQQAWGMALPDEPGLTMPEMIEAAHEGHIEAMYILGENPVLSEPDANHVVETLRSLDFLVVQDIFLTETARLADVVLPGVTFAEKDGTFTNTERRVQLVRKAVEPIGDSWPDWKIVSTVARAVCRKTGLDEKAFDYESPAQIMDEIARLTPSYGGISHARLAEVGSLQWPCPDASHPGTPILHVGKFSRGLGRFMPLKFIPPAELPDEEYPLVLTTGRKLYHYHTGSMTRRVEGLQSIAPEERVEVSLADAEVLEICSGDLVKVTSRRGEVVARAEVTDRVPVGVIFMTFHYAESAANLLTNTALDPISKMPEVKVCAVKVERVAEEPAGAGAGAHRASVS